MKYSNFLVIGALATWAVSNCAIQGQTWAAVPAPPLSPNIATFTPQQQLGGDYVALWDECCSPESQPYVVPTNADGSGHGYMTKNNVWGLDEGVSAESQDPTHSGRIYWFFGDTETAFPDGSQWGIFGLYGEFYPISSPTSPYPGCISNGTGTNSHANYSTMYGLCLGNDTIAFTDSAQASKISTCNFLGSVEWYANHTSPSYASTSVPTGTLYGNCNLTQFINDSGSGAGVAPISAHVSPALPSDDSMLTGLTPNGAFTLMDPTYNDDNGNKEESIFLIYTVKATGASQEQINYPTSTSSPQTFGTPTILARSVLLKSTATGDITATNPPTFSANTADSVSGSTIGNQIGTFSQLPTGLVTVNTSGGTTTMTLCSGGGDQFLTAWNSANWQIVITAPALGKGWDYFYNSVPTTFGVNPNGYAYEGAYYPLGNALPYTGTMTVTSTTTVTLVAGTGTSVPPNSSTCTLGTAYWYAAVPAEGQTGPGKFMHVSAEVMATSTMPAYIKKNLPSTWTANNYAKLPAKVVFFFGASSHYRASNLYLAVMDYVDVLNDSLSHSSMSGLNQNGDPTTIYVNTGGGSGQGVNNAFYMSSFTPSSNPVDNPDGDTVGWTAGDETVAVPLFTDWTNQGTQPRTLSGETSALPCIGEQSVRYQPNLLDNSSSVEPNRPLFLLTYGSWDCGGLYARSSIVPWGQWSGEFQFLANLPVNLNKAYNGDNAAIAATVPGSEPGGCVSSTGQDCFNPNFTLWYPQIVYEPGVDTLAQTDGFLPNESSTNADESFNTNYPNGFTYGSLTNLNLLYCLNAGSYWGSPPSYWGCTTSPYTANNGSGTPHALAVSPFIDPTTGSPFLGNPYGAYQYPASSTTLSAGGTATVFMNVSTFNPYRVLQSRVTFTAEAPPAAGSAQVSQQ
jgi:hypothetical protein